MEENGGAPTTTLSQYAFTLWNLVIRPPRATYDPATALGPAEFSVGGVKAARRDVRLRTPRGLRLSCSHFVPRQDRTKEPLRKFPVIVYLHGNSSSRLECGAIVGQLLAQNISVFCYDAAGCGLSEGDYVSLGYYERDDLSAVIAHLRQSPFCGPIGLWGRSMGAVTALMYADRDPDLGAICLDSPFTSLRELAKELAMSKYSLIPVPSFLVNAALAVVRMRVQTLAGFDIEDVVPLDSARRSLIPAIFMHAREDNFIPMSHSRQLYAAYAGEKELLTIDGDHNSERSEQAINHAVAFFKRAFRLEEVDLQMPTGSYSHLVEAEPAAPQPQRPRTPQGPPPGAVAPPLQQHPGSRLSGAAPPGPLAHPMGPGQGVPGLGPPCVGPAGPGHAAAAQFGRPPQPMGAAPPTRHAAMAPMEGLGSMGGRQQLQQQQQQQQQQWKPVQQGYPQAPRRAGPRGVGVYGGA